MSQQSFDEYLTTVGHRIAEHIGHDQQSLIQAIKLIWDGIYQSGATPTPNAPPRPVNSHDYLQGVQEGYEVGKQEGREEAFNG